jgi:hypothetical protein
MRIGIWSSVAPDESVIVAGHGVTVQGENGVPSLPRNDTEERRERDGWITWNRDFSENRCRHSAVIPMSIFTLDA